MLYDRNSHLYEPIFQNPSVVPVMQRFGISLGVGDISIAGKCEELGIPEDFFLAIINTYLNDQYNPILPESTDYAMHILNYLEKTDMYYKNIQLPNVENHFNLLIGRSGQRNGNLNLLNRFFQEVKEEFRRMIANDTDCWFPILRELLNIEDKKEREHKFAVLTATQSLVMPFDYSQLNEKLADLLTFFTIHLQGEYNSNLCVAVVTSLFTLEKDVNQNSRIRMKIFLPAIAKLVGGYDNLQQHN